MPGRVLVLYHFFYPDELVSAQHYTELALSLRDHGWDVHVAPSNRSRLVHANYPLTERWKGITIHRVWRPDPDPDWKPGRLVSAAWVISAWGLEALRKRSFPDIDVIIYGTDPVFYLPVATFWKAARPETRVVHWCFDLSPDIAIEDGMLRRDSLAGRVIIEMSKRGYRDCDLVMDRSPCQRRRLDAYDIRCARATCIPWALVEPEAPLPIHEGARRATFGDASLALLYSGNMGRSHEYGLFLELARRLRDSSVKMVFGARGYHVDALRRESAHDPNVAIAGFASLEELEARLSAADIHLVSLRQEATGALVPSKFFAALAVGRPAIFYGSESSSVANWIRTHRVGWVLTPATLDQVTAELRQLSQRPEALKELNERCHRVYQTWFSRKVGTDRWHEELERLVSARG